MGFERQFACLKTQVVILPFLCFVAFAYFYLDANIAYYFHQKNPPILDHVLNSMAYLGEAYLWVAFLFILALFFRFVQKNQKWEQRMWLLWWCVFIPNGFAALLKITLGRARPTLLFEQHLYGFFGPHFQHDYWSFPSGHTTTIVALTLGLSMCYPRHGRSLFLAGFILSLLRIVVTEHYLSDVLATTCLVFFEISILNYYFKHKRLFPLVYPH